MVSAYLVDALRDPTSELQELFASSTYENFPKVVESHFSNVFSSSNAFEQIPILDVRSPPEAYLDGALVRFRGMVQDTSQPSEMYLRKTHSGKVAGWGIQEEKNSSLGDLNYDDLRECSVIWAVSVPGETQWCADELDGDTEQRLTHETHQPPRAHKHPDPSIPHIGVQVKLYNTEVAEKLKVTDVVTFIGILTKEPLNIEVEQSQDVPTLHVLFTRVHGNARISRPYPLQPHRGIDVVRQELIDWIAEQGLGGDKDAAEWILLASIAKVQSRHPPLFPLSITLSRFPSPPPMPSTGVTGSEARASSSALFPSLSYVISQLLPLAHILPLSLDLLNTARFAPESKDEDLHSGVLQLPSRSVLLVTEGGVREGKLIEQGLRNIRALQEVITSQSLAYSFPFSQFSFPTDISCIVLSEGRKSTFFKTDLTVPLALSNQGEGSVRLYKPPESVSLPSPVQLEVFRDIIVGAQQGKVNVSESVGEHIQQEFVEERQKDKSITSDDLIRRMVVAKLYALSLHETELSLNTWERAKALDARTRART